MNAESKRFGTPPADDSPPAPQGGRAGSQVPEGALNSDDASLRSKLMHASKKVCTCNHTT